MLICCEIMIIIRVLIAVYCGILAVLTLFIIFLENKFKISEKLCVTFRIICEFFTETITFSKVCALLLQKLHTTVKRTHIVICYVDLLFWTLSVRCVEIIFYYEIWFFPFSCIRGETFLKNIKSNILFTPLKFTPQKCNSRTTLDQPCRMVCM